ncbi:MAG: hypothetical protein KatS3mg009_2007 [Acidimicrobiia bacterium]|nr:MAG: hypothetical protein KatS3mg009_2007 [Acidimicrobiia bacterium]
MLAVALVATVVVLAGCDDGGDDPADQVRDAVAGREPDEEGWQELADDVERNPRAVLDVDPCALLTRDDAGALFGVEAHEQRSSEPARVGVACIWAGVEGSEDEEVNHFLQFRAYDGEAYYGEVIYAQEDRQQVAELGERAFAARDPVHGGVDVEWVQDGRTFSINYSTFSFADDTSDDEAMRRLDEVVELARRVARRAERMIPAPGAGATTATTATTTTTTTTGSEGGTGG